MGYAALLQTSQPQLSALHLLSPILIYLEAPAGEVFSQPRHLSKCEGRTWAGVNCWWGWVSNPGRETRDQLGLSALVLSWGQLVAAA